MADGENAFDVERFLETHGAFEVAPSCKIGDIFESWRITAFLGRGGSGEVYRVEHEMLGTAAALKVLTKESPSARARFRREAEFLAANRCATFPKFLAYGMANGKPFIVEELLEPLELPSREAEVVAFLLRLCAGVGELHRMRLVHRDLKPMNILRRIGTDDPVLIDFGLVSDVADTTVLPTASIVDGHAVGVGTPGFSAPEQFTGAAISPATDIHALGAIAHACFGGKPPRTWARIIRRATSSIPEQRYASTDELARAIRQRNRGWKVGFLAACVASFGLGLAVLGIRWYATQKANWQLAVAEAQANVLQEAILGIDSPQEVEVEQVRWEDLFHPQVCAHRRVAEIDLKGHSLRVENPVILPDDVDVYVNGPGTLDIDVTGSCQSSIRIQRDGKLLNRTFKSATESPLWHVVDDNSYLNFVNLKNPSRGEKRNVQIGTNAKRLIIRYGGPSTRREAQLEHYRQRGILKGCMTKK